MKGKCENPNHDGSESVSLTPIYYERLRDGKVCRIYWCDDCAITYADESGQLGGYVASEDGRLRDEGGRFAPTIRCQQIPGLD